MEANNDYVVCKTLKTSSMLVPTLLVHSMAHPVRISFINSASSYQRRLPMPVAVADILSSRSPLALSKE